VALSFFPWNNYIIAYFIRNAIKKVLIIYYNSVKCPARIFLLTNIIISCIIILGRKDEGK